MMDFSLVIISHCGTDGVKYIWTSGRKCDFDGCNRADLQPTIVNGWFWSGSEAKIPPTDQRALGDWSNTGGDGRPQPDNREDDVSTRLPIDLTSFLKNISIFFFCTGSKNKICLLLFYRKVNLAWPS